mgnify:CR=1 FL=1
MAGGFRLYSRRSIVNENEKKTSDWKMIIGGIALIAVLFVGVFGVEGFAYTIILYFILSACMLPLKRQKS